jgi:O-antigen/teichoic acid export membrane protein
LAANGVGAALGQVIEVVALISLARTLSATDVATYFLILQGIRFAYILESGMGQDLTRSLAGTSQLTNDNAHRTMKSGVVWYAWLFVASTVAVLIGSLVVKVTNSEVNGRLFFLVGLATSLRILSDGCARALTGLMMLIRTRSISFARSVGLLMVALVLAPIGSGPFGMGILGLEILLFVASVIPLRHRIHASWPYLRYTSKEYGEVVTPMAKANVTGFLSNRLDGFFVGFFVGTPAVVIHGILLRVYDVARGGIELLMTGVVQAVSVSWRVKNNADLSSALKFAVGVSTIVAAIGGVLVFVARPILDAAFPQQINVSVWTYVAVATALIMVSQSVAYVYVATGLNLINRLLVGVYLSSAVNFVTTLVATWLLGVAGPFIGIAVGGFVSTFAHPWRLRSEISDWTDSSEIRRMRLASCLTFLTLIAASFLVESNPFQFGIACASVVMGGLMLRRVPLKQFLKVAHIAR